MKIKKVRTIRGTCKGCFFRAKATGVCAMEAKVKMKCMITHQNRFYIFVLTIRKF